MLALHIAQTLCDLLTDIIGIVKFVKVIVSITCIPFFCEPGDSGWQVTSLRVDNSIPFFRELGDSGWLAIGLLVDSSISFALQIVPFFVSIVMFVVSASTLKLFYRYFSALG